MQTREVMVLGSSTWDWVQNTKFTINSRSNGRICNEVSRCLLFLLIEQLIFFLLKSSQGGLRWFKVEVSGSYISSQVTKMWSMLRAKHLLYRYLAALFWSYCSTNQICSWKSWIFKLKGSLIVPVYRLKIGTRNVFLYISLFMFILWYND